MEQKLLYENISILVLKILSEIELVKKIFRKNVDKWAFLVSGQFCKSLPRTGS